MPRRSRVHPTGERDAGYALIGALWFLLLAASLAGVLMLRSVTASRDVAATRSEVRDRYRLESALETAKADLVINGPRSALAQLPGIATYVIDGQPVFVTVTSEAGRVDINEADRALIERAMSALGASAAQRSDLVQAVLARRAAGQRPTALAQVAGMIEMADGGQPTRACVLDAFTVHSGLALPVTGLNPAMLAPIIGTVPLNAPSPPAGTPLRLAARTDAGLSLGEVVVIGGQGALPALVIDRWMAGQCDR